MSITASFAGHTCNNMFQYATLRLIAKLNGYEFYVPPHIRERLGKFVKCDMGCDSFEQKYDFTEPYDQPFIPELLTPGFIKDGTHIHGFFQTHKYFKGNEAKVMEWFEINPLLGHDNLCLIHFRGGDYVGGWNYLPESYYREAMHMIKQLNPNVYFEVVTDDVANARKYFPDLHVTIDTPVFDFKRLMSADYLILSNSSFSWWAAYLNCYSKKTIAPERWFNYNKNYDKAGLGKTEANNNDWYPLHIHNTFFTWI